MVDYELYRKYLNELVQMYREKKSLAGMSYIAKKYNVTHLNKELFFEYGLHKKEGELTMAEVKKIRNSVSDVRKIRDYERYERNKQSVIAPFDGFDRNNIPEGFELVKISEGKEFGYALKCDSAIDSANCCLFIVDCAKDAIRDGLYKMLSNLLGDTVIELYSGRCPLPCVNGDMSYAPLYMAKCANNGVSYFLSSSSVILVGLAWICKSLEKEGWK